ncbi:MAG TPA: hypothetical protein EYH56_00745 [Nanoarchaeota archaeon]|nr:hypothetical protein [Nanoarchaeota archaeon]
MPLIGVVIVNVIIALILFLVAFRTYKSYKLRIFKNAWLIITIGSVLWLIGTLLLLVGEVGVIHTALFTIFIILLTIALYLLSKVGETLGV